MIKAVVFDWAGTMVDFGSLAPMDAFVRVFAEHGIKITVEQARIPMGLEKWDHIHALLQMPEIASQWQAQAGHAPRNDDVYALLDAFTPMSRVAIRQHADLIPGARDVFEALCRRGIRVASTTGYSRALMNVLGPLASEQGYRPELIVVPDDVERARPAPDMMQLIARHFDINDPREIIKVDDTLPGIEEGRNFGAWTVAVAVTGNTMGLSLEQWNALSPAQRELNREIAWRKIEKMEPDFIVDSVGGLMSVLDAIER